MPDQSSAASEHALMQEITAPLETLPDDPLAIVDAEFPTAMRGYDRHAVDDYVDQVTQLVGELHATRSPEAAVRRALERVGEQIAGVLQRAHQTAEQITTQSRVEAEDRLEQARREAATLIEAAEQRVRELDADTDHIWGERQRIIADAEELSGRLHAVAREAAERFPYDDGRGAADAGATPFDAGAPPSGPAPGAAAAGGADENLPVPEIEQTRAFAPLGGPEPVETGEPPALDPLDSDAAGDELEATRAFELEPRRITDEDSTQVIPPSSDAAQHRRDG